MISLSKFNPLLRAVSRHISLTDTEAGYLRSIVSLRRIRKRHALLQAGEVCNFENYVVRGCLRGYHLDLEGSEHTTFLAMEDWWISDLESLVKRTPATMTIEAIEDTEVLQIAQGDFENLYRKNPKFERLFRILLQNAFIAHQRRILAVISQPAEQRYREFVVRYPAFAQRVPQKYIASFIGVTPEFLSRIRRDLARKPSRG